MREFLINSAWIIESGMNNNSKVLKLGEEQHLWAMKRGKIFGPFATEIAGARAPLTPLVPSPLMKQLFFHKIFFYLVVLHFKVPASSIS